MTAAGYAGDLVSSEAYEVLARDPKAVLVDVRTLPEWQFVGVPDLKAIDKSPVFLSWQDYPEMAVREDFARALQDQGVTPDQKVLIICRSGQRSRSAAIALTAAGFAEAYNVSDGFEGPLDQRRQRGQLSGWKAAGLPWGQQ